MKAEKGAELMVSRQGQQGAWISLPSSWYTPSPCCPLRKHQLKAALLSQPGIFMLWHSPQF
eukprot:1153364-Pelagomonas_calceolata.AAC.1